MLGQVPEEEREVYMKGQHLRGVDAALAEQARAEIVRGPTLSAACRPRQDHL